MALDGPGHSILELYLSGMMALTAVVAVLILISSLDDLFIDITAILRHTYRQMFIYTRYKRLSEDDLSAIAEQPVAILLPAWQEADVIRAMLENSCATYDYAQYHVFVGIYPNDPDTLREVRAAARRFPNITPVMGPAPGPTSKADCLNATFARIQDHERKHGVKFEIFVIHDAEDVVHPLELKLLNYLIPRKDMVQLPVVALERPLCDMTGGHYMDEFAEFHTKDLIVREWLTGSVPCAGVGCGFSRRAMVAMSRFRSGQPFNPGSMTEDYEFALTLNRLGLSQIFVRFAILRARANMTSATAHRKTRMVRDLVATREYFPNDLSAAVRQKARWFLGIVFQGWQTNRWRGPLRFKYALIRDRKGLFTAMLSVLAYFILLNALVLLLIARFMDGGLDVPPMARPGGWLWYVLIANGALLLNRILHRALYTGRIYGPAQALISAPRQVWGNVINFLAALRAIWLFTRHKVIGNPLAWDKTSHAFPTEQELRPFRDRLGQILRDRGHLTKWQLSRALAHQRRRGIPLGQVLLDRAHVDEDVLYGILAEQTGLPLANLSNTRPLNVAGSKQEYLSNNRIVAFGTLADGTLQLATARPVTDTFRADIARRMGGPVAWFLAHPSEIDRLLAEPRKEAAE